MSYIDPAITDPNTGRAVAPDNLNNTGFPGQIFFNPVAGTIGTLQWLQFDGPSLSTVDFAVAKRFSFGGPYSAEIRGEFFNFFNRPVFGVDDYDINSVNFGTLTFLEVDPRVVQLSVKLSF